MCLLSAGLIKFLYFICVHFSDENNVFSNLSELFFNPIRENGFFFFFFGGGGGEVGRSYFSHLQTAI